MSFQATSYIVFLLHFLMIVEKFLTRPVVAYTIYSVVLNTIYTYQLRQELMMSLHLKKKYVKNILYGYVLQSYPVGSSI